MTTQPQPKFKMWQKVKSRDDVFIITGIESGAEGYSYWGDENSFIVMESGLTEVKEPLKAEFECEWTECPDSKNFHPAGLSYPRRDGNPIREFIGKRTKVTIEEIL